MDDEVRKIILSMIQARRLCVCLSFQLEYLHHKNKRRDKKEADGIFDGELRS